MEENKQYEQLKKDMVELFNFKMKEEGCNIKYVEAMNDLGVQIYKIIIENRFIDNTYDSTINLTKEGEKEIREFFETRGVKFQFSNTVRNII